MFSLISTAFDNQTYWAKLKLKSYEVTMLPGFKDWQVQDCQVVRVLCYKVANLKFFQATKLPSSKVSKWRFKKCIDFILTHCSVDKLQGCTANLYGFQSYDLKQI